ncbi:urea amidolyase associated protein UAAP1 [Promicromonospora sp. Populi]|uniref:urea amidolyase associated protein UAAP1 n=1 Tax=Promicromonospora sp. Populi TaxID=3239420 RepID=UPI0034E1CA2D
MTTATTTGAKAHAREQEGAAAPGLPRVLHPASAYPGDLPQGVTADDLVWAETVPPGGYTSLVVAAGTRVRVRDTTGDACAHLLAFHADQPTERLNVADTVKVQWQAFLTTGHLLLSDQGRALATIVEDTAGNRADAPRHDALFGTSTLARNTERYGSGDAFGPSPAGRELFALAAAKHGLARRDIPPSVTFFEGVSVSDAGRAAFVGSPGPASLTLVAELPLIVLLASTAHPLDSRREFVAGPLDVVAWPGAPTQPGDPRWAATPEGRRAYENSTAHRRTRGAAR